MSNLVDMWTAELAKLREKGRAALSGSSSPRSPTERTGAQEDLSLASEPEELSLGYPGLRPAARTRPMPLHMPRTEEAVSMLVDCFSP